MPHRRGRARGFTLIEILVAFTILAVAMVALVQAFSSGLRGLGSAEASAVALAHARAKLEEIGSVIPLEAGEVAGEFDDGYRWTALIRAHESGDGAELDATPVQPFEVEVTVSGERGGAVTLRSLRLAPRQ